MYSASSNLSPDRKEHDSFVLFELAQEYGNDGRVTIAAKTRLLHPKEAGHSSD